MNQRFTIDYSNEYACGVGFFDNGKRISMDKVNDLLNRFNNILVEKDELLQKQIAVSQNLDKQLAEREKELANIKRTLDDMIDNERTKLGANALIQYREAIQ